MCVEGRRVEEGGRSVSEWTNASACERSGDHRAPRCTTTRRTPCDAHPQRRSVRRDDAEEGREGGREGAAEREHGGDSVFGRGGRWKREKGA